jgi:quinol monooxygenase YgiN
LGFTSDAQPYNEEHVMKVAVIWEFRFGATNEPTGLEVTRKIWNDMQQSPDCLDHEIIRDEQEPGHVLVISHWSSSEAADAVKNRYAAHPNAVVANQLALDPPARWVGLPEITVPPEREAA